VEVFMSVRDDIDEAEAFPLHKTVSDFLLLNAEF
jgi:hypothetical protein